MRELAHLRDDRGGRHRGDPAERLQRLDNGAHLRRRGADRLEKRGIQVGDPGGDAIHFMQMVREHQKRLHDRYRTLGSKGKMATR